MHAVRKLAPGVLWLTVGCGGGDIPPRTDPCTSPDHWPLALASETHPFTVHHRRGEEEMAERVAALLDRSWSVEVDQLGFRPPLPDGGRCGDDDGFDVFLWDGLRVAYADVIAENHETPHDDWFSYLALDPWGPYGGDILDSTVAHEFNHACQASDDWWDLPIAFEMTSVFVEDEVVDADNDYVTHLRAFQSRTDWALDHNDDYATWYMYGSGLYLTFLRDRYFAGDGRFAADLWLGMRSPAGDNEPDLEDAIDQVLGAQAGVDFLDSAVEFAKWRWYTGDRDDGAHFEEGATWPDEAEVAVAGSASVADLPVDVEIAVMALGTAYVDLGGGPVSVRLDGADPGVAWVAQVVPGAAGDGDLVDLTAGPVVVDATSPRTLILVALPHPEDADPDDRTDAIFGATLHLMAP